MRIINTPTRGIGDKCIAIVFNEWEREPLLDGIALLKKLYDTPDNGLNRTQRAGFGQLISILTTLPSDSSPSALVNHVMTSTGYRDHLRKSYEEPELSSRIDNCTELQQAAHNFEQEHEGADLSLFLEQIMLLQEEGKEDEKAAEHVSLMTLHAALRD